MYGYVSQAARHHFFLLAWKCVCVCRFPQLYCIPLTPCSLVLLLWEYVLKITNYETRYEVPSVPFYYHIVYYFPYHPIFGRDMDWRLETCCHDWVVYVVLIGWFMLSLLSGFCCYYWVVSVVLIGRFVLSLLGGTCCQHWTVCVIIIGWFVLLLLGG